MKKTSTFDDAKQLQIATFQIISFWNEKLSNGTNFVIKTKSRNESKNILIEHSASIKIFDSYLYKLGNWTSSYIKISYERFVVSGDWSLCQKSLGQKLITLLKVYATYGVLTKDTKTCGGLG